MTTPVIAAATAQDNKIKTYRPDIDGLRAIAVLAVMGFHAFPSWVGGGFVGVDVFFVISGFLISGILMRGLEHGSFSIRKFYSRRIRRIFPALSVTLVACYVYGWIVLLPKEYGQLGKHIAAGAGFVSNLILWGEAGYFDRAAHTKPLLHLWSLGIEEQFYIVWPLLLWCLWKTRLNILVCCGVLAVASFALNINWSQADQVAAFYSPVTRLWELLIGSCLARISMRPPGAFASVQGRLGRNVQAALGLACIGAAILMIRAESVFPGWWALLPTVGTYLVISAGPASWLNRYVLGNSILVWVGLISYPLYLWHWVLLSFASQLEFGMPTRMIRVTLLVISVILAWGTYRFIERPIRFGPPGYKVLIACGVMVAVGVAGWLTYARGGLIFRFPVGVRQLLNYTYDPAVNGRTGECWLPNSNPYEEFASSCVDRSNKENSVVVWGDSHSGRLYSGLKNVAPKDMAISDFARNHCPPVIGFGSPTCIRSNAYVVERIQELHPKTVIMFATWVSYQTGLDSNSYTSQHLIATVDELKRRGAQNIVVIGPAPYWKEALPTLLARRAIADAPFYRVPDRMSTGLDTQGDQSG